MAKKFFKKWISDHNFLKEHKHLKVFGQLIHDPNLWHLNRYSVATAFSVGLFVAFIPVPFQMVIAGALAIIVHANLPISIALVWLTNPLTMGPIFYFCYRVGAWILVREPRRFKLEFGYDWLIDNMYAIGIPFLLGCFITGSFLAISSNFLIRMIWRYSVSKNWRERRLKRKQKRELKQSKKRRKSKPS
ncbi:MAG TPA: DUF2062 domain-containing protein [Gammaproteobacteria bacterium]|nr:DUF2062 domain-containing protein [Gammaproteobacteria bacterium]